MDHNSKLETRMSVNSKLASISQIGWIKQGVMALWLVAISGALLLSSCATDDLAGLATRDASTTDPSALAENLAKAEAARKNAAAIEPTESFTRDVASSYASTDGKLEQSFTKLMNTPLAADYLNQEVGRLLSIDALSDLYLTEFDKQLDAAASEVHAAPSEKAEDKSDEFLRNEPYAKLMAAHRLQIEAEKRLSYFLYRALETKWNEDLRPEYRQGAIQLVDHFKYTLQRRRDDYASPEMQRLADHFLKSQTDVVALLGAAPRAATAGPHPASVSMITAPAMDLNALLLEIKAVQSSSPEVTIVSKISQVNRKTSAAKSAKTEIETLEKQILESWTAESAAAKEATISKIEPSAGPSGTLNGTRFAHDTWALTYEGGPSPHDVDLMASLSKAQSHATFFWNAEGMFEQKSVVEKARLSGMGLATQSFSGFDLAPEEATPEHLQHEVIDAVSLQTKAYGVRPTLFRCPFASCAASEEVRNSLESQKMVQVLWNVDGLMWKDAKTESIYNRIRKQMKIANHGIISMQDTDSRVAVLTDMLLKDFATPSRLRLITVQENIDSMNRPIARNGQ